MDQLSKKCCGWDRNTWVCVSLIMTVKHVPGTDYMQLYGLTHGVHRFIN